MFLRRMFNNGYQSMSKILDDNPAEGLGALWLGDYTAAQDKKLLRDNSIRTVVTTASGLGISFFPTDGITHYQYNLLDIPTQNISHCFESTYRDINEGLKRGGVFVHCAAGISRSTTCLIAFLMKKNQTNYRQTLSMVRNKRSIVCPNVGFERQLLQFEQTLGLSNKNSRIASNLVIPSEEKKQSLTTTLSRVTPISSEFGVNVGMIAANGNNKQLHDLSNRNKTIKNTYQQQSKILTELKLPQNNDLYIMGINKILSQVSSLKGESSLQNHGPNIVTYNARSNIRTTSRGPVIGNFMQGIKKPNNLITSRPANVATLSNFRKSHAHFAQ